MVQPVCSKSLREHGVLTDSCLYHMLIRVLIWHTVLSVNLLTCCNHAKCRLKPWPAAQQHDSRVSMATVWSSTKLLQFFMLQNITVVCIFMDPIQGRDGDLHWVEVLRFLMSLSSFLCLIWMVIRDWMFLYNQSEVTCWCLLFLAWDFCQGSITLIED